MSKIFLCITTQNEYKNIEELTSISQYFDGLAAVDHFSTDGTYELLQGRKGVGFVEQIPYVGNHSHSLNHALFNPKIEVDDWILLRDSNERVNPDFAAGIKNFVRALELSSVSTVYQYSKLLLFRRCPQQYFQSTPHWGFVGARANGVQIEKTGFFEKDEDYCYSVRNINRDKYHFVGAYLRYYLLLDSNHNLLGLENRGNPHELFPKLEVKRVEFRKQLAANGYPITVEGVRQLLDQARFSGLAEWAKPFFNENKILNDYYRWYYLDQKDFNDDHDHNNMIKIN